MKKLLTTTLLSLGVLGIFAGSQLDNSNLTFSSKPENSYLKTYTQPKRQDEVTDFYWMSDDDLSEWFDPTAPRLFPYWSSASEIGYETPSYDFFAVDNITYDGTYKIDLRWNHLSANLNPSDTLIGNFNLDLYKDGEVEEHQKINFSFKNEFTFFTTIELKVGDYDQFDLTYNFKTKEQHGSTFLEGKSLRKTRLNLKDYFAFTAKSLDFLSYDSTDKVINFSTMIDLKNGKSFIPTENELGIKVDKSYFKATPLSDSKMIAKQGATKSNYQVPISKKTLIKAKKVEIVLNKSSSFDITNLVDNFIEENNLAPQFVFGINAIIVATAIGIILLLFFLLLILLLIKRRKKASIPEESKTYVDLTGAYIQFTQKEWEALSRRKKKWYKEVPKSDLLNGYYEFHSHDDQNYFN